MEAHVCRGTQAHACLYGHLNSRVRSVAFSREGRKVAARTTSAYACLLRDLDVGLEEPHATVARSLRDVLTLEDALGPRVLAAAGSDGPRALIALALPEADPDVVVIERVE